MTPKQQLLEYRKEKYRIQESTGASELGHDIKTDLHNGVQVLSEQLYSKDVHFVFELIQNAEDNHYAEGASPKLHFELMKDDPTGTEGAKGCLAVYNNELGFELKNVKAVSSVGGSTKKDCKDSGYIGEKGIGFKSVFSVTPSPHIYSNGFQFSFRDKDEQTGLGYIVPYWEERVPEIVQEKLETYNTCILLPLRDDPERDCFAKIRQELNNLDASLLLFLSKISELTVNLDGSTRRYAKEEHGEYTSLINESEGECSTVEYVVRKKTIEVPEGLNESKRENVTRRELCLAFPKGLASADLPRHKVFSYLPTEVFSGLPFLVNADFLLPASRESILVDKKWNHWICEQVAEFASESICELVQALPMGEAFNWIPVQANCNLEFLEPIFERVVNSLCQLDFVPTTDGAVVTPKEVILAPLPLTERLQGIKCERDYEGLRFISRDALDYEKQLAPLLDPIESKPQNLANFLQACEDSLLEQPMPWFVDFYSWLSRPANSWTNKYLFANVPLIPCEGGMLLASKEHVFQSTNRHISYPKLVNGESRAEFALLNPELQGLLAKEPMTREFIKSFFGIMPMSQDEFLFSVALPFCAEHLNELTEDSLWELNQFTIQNWDALSKGNKSTLSSTLPLKNETGEFVINAHNAQLVVTPPSYESGCEWKTIYSEEEQSDFIVLSDEYLHLLNQYAKRSALDVFAVLGARRLPLKYRKIRLLDSSILDNEAFSLDYRSYLYSQFRNMWSGPSNPYKEGCLTVAPRCLWKSQLFESGDFREVFYQWLTQALKLELERASTFYRKTDWKSEPIKHFYNCERQTSVDTELWFALKNLAWLPTNNGLKAIGEVFVATDENTRTYGDALNFVSDEVPRELVELLEVPTEISADSIVETLRFWSTNNLEIDSKKLATIYRRLDSQHDDLQALFANEALIYCPSGDKNWCTSEKAIWSSQSAVLGDKFHWLSEHYGEQLHLFWTSSIGVAERPDAKHYALAWLELQEDSTETDPREQLEVIYDRLISFLRKLGEAERPDWLVKFADEARCFSYKNKAHGSDWVYPNNIYASDIHPSLRVAFEREGAEFVWIPDGKQHSRYDLLYQLLGVRYASEALVKSAEFVGEQCDTPDKPLLTGATKKLLACLVKSNSDKDWLSSEQLSEVIGATETLVGESINVEFELDSAEVSSSSNTYADRQKIYYVMQDDDEALKEDIAAELSKMLFKRDFRRHEDTITRVLGVSDARAESFMERKGWTLSKKEMGAISAMIAVADAERKTKVEATPPEMVSDEAILGENTLSESSVHPEAEPEKSTIEAETPVVVSEKDETEATESNVAVSEAAIDGIDQSVHDEITNDTEVPAEAVDAVVAGVLRGSVETTKPRKEKRKASDARIRYKKSTASKELPASKKPNTDAKTQGDKKAPRATLSLSNTKESSQTTDTGHSTKSGNKANAPKPNKSSKESSAGYRMLSYVSQEGHESSERCESTSEEVMEYANRAERLICEQLEQEGFETTLLGGTNPGYDILAKPKNSDESIYVEVKSVLTNWNATGVGLSKTQFELSQREQDNYWLYVVEHMASDEPVVHRIVNPAEKIGTYYFDHNWRKLVEKEDKQRAEREEGLELYDMFDGDADALFEDIMQSTPQG